MSDQIANRGVAREGDVNGVLLPILSASIIDNIHVFAGAAAGLDVNGRAVKGSAAAATQVVGTFRKEYDNTVAGHVIDAFSVEIVIGAQAMLIGAGGDALTNANKNQDVYLVDDQTVGATDGGGTRLRAGYLVEVVGTRAFVMFGVANPNASAGSGGGGGGGGAVGASSARARGVVIANVAALATFTVANNGITYEANDLVLLTAQTTAAENGLYKVGTVAAGVAPLTRPDGWATGDSIPAGYVVEIGAGNTLLPSSSWKAMVVKGKIVGTDDPLFYPRVVKARVTLVAGTMTMGSAEGTFLFSAAGASTVDITQNTPNTTTNTTEYCAVSASRTAGVSGTAAIVIRANVAAGTINVADISTLDVTISNW